jgi:hypothetical protein
MPLTPCSPPRAKSDASLASSIDHLFELPLDDLRQRWRSTHSGVPLPKGLSRDLMVRGVAWAEQCSRYGGPTPASQRSLYKMARQLKTSGNLQIERSVRPKTGTRIIREWQGGTYVVEVADDGFIHEGNKFASLSHVARAITGTRWSGPRFFGLKSEEASKAGDGKGQG